MNDIEFARFMSHVEVGECWLWSGCKSHNGYGWFRLRGVMYKTHRLMLERVLGRALGEGIHALHSCRNKHCCRPEHLREGTHIENMDDRDKDRTTAVGERAGLAKLCDAEIDAIRNDMRIYRLIAEDYKVSISTIGKIKNRNTWSHI